MQEFNTITYAAIGRIARVTLNRPGRGNGITSAMPRELALAVEQANLDPDVHVIALAGSGKGFCGGYDLVASAERILDEREARDARAFAPKGSAVDPTVAA